MRFYSIILLLLLVGFPSFLKGSKPFKPDSIPPPPKMVLQSNDSALVHTYINIIFESRRIHAESADSKRSISREEGRIRNHFNETPTYLIYIFFLAFFVLAITKISDNGYFGKLFTSILNTNQLKGMYSEGQFRFNFVNLVLDSFFIFSLSVMIQQVFFRFHNEYFLWICLFTAGAYYVKILLIQISSYLFFDKTDDQFQILFNLLFSRLTALLLLPIIFCITYQTFYSVHILNVVVFKFLLVGYIMWLLRLLIKMKLEGIGGFFYVFLYLCTLEVFPLLIVLKTFFV